MMELLHEDSSLHPSENFIHTMTRSQIFFLRDVLLGTALT